MLKGQKTMGRMNKDITELKESLQLTNDNVYLNHFNQEKMLELFDMIVERMRITGMNKMLEIVTGKISAKSMENLEKALAGSNVHDAFFEHKEWLEFYKTLKNYNKK